MDVNSIISARRVSNLLESLESIRDELLNLTLPLKRSFNEKGRNKKALLARFNELTAEVEGMISSLSERKDVESMRIFTSRVREIIEEKEKLSAELSELKD